MNTSRFLHTRAEFTPEGTTEKYYGWVQNIRHFEISLAVSREYSLNEFTDCLVRLSSESAVAVFNAPIHVCDPGNVTFHLPLPLQVDPGDDQARVQVRGQFALVSTMGLDFIAEIEDVSLGGMAFVIPIPCEPHSSLLARLPGTEDKNGAPCEVRYCLRLAESPSLYRVGVRFEALSVLQGDALRKIMLSPISRAA
jgi:hypothetical protein